MSNINNLRKLLDDEDDVPVQKISRVSTPQTSTPTDVAPVSSYRERYKHLLGSSTPSTATVMGSPSATPVTQSSSLSIESQYSGLTDTQNRDSSRGSQYSSSRSEKRPRDSDRPSSSGDRGRSDVYWTDRERDAGRSRYQDSERNSAGRSRDDDREWRAAEARRDRYGSQESYDRARSGSSGGVRVAEERQTEQNAEEEDFEARFLLEGEAESFSVEDLRDYESSQRQRESAAAASTAPLRLSAQTRLRMADQASWESSRLGTPRTISHLKSDGTGVVDATDLDSERKQIAVHVSDPPFLKARTSRTAHIDYNPNFIDFAHSQSGASEEGSILQFRRGGAEGPPTCRDPKSDIAELAKRPCPSVQQMREKKSKELNKQKFWEISGSRMGALVGTPASESSKPDESSSNGTVGSSSSSEKPRQHKKSIKEVRESLPIFKARDTILQHVREHQVIVVVGETGSGKTTQLTQYLREDGWSRRGQIACTQPRRVAATSVAARVAVESGVKLGEEVGYSIRFEDRSSNRTEIKYMTDGILLREVLHDPDLNRYSVIVMDEVHERSLNTDVLFGVLRTLLARRRDLRLVVTSATMNADKFSAFFGGCPVFYVPGRTFPVIRQYRRAVPEDYVAAAVQKVLEIHLGDEDGDILVFMTGQEDVEATCSLLAEKMDKLVKEQEELIEIASQAANANAGEKESRPLPKSKQIKPIRTLSILPMYSQLPQDLQDRIFESAYSADAGVHASARSRKCIVATNIAETSLTVDGITFVVDTGLSKVKSYNARVGMETLLIAPISQASAEQRAGRAGRTAPGTCYRLYTESTFRNDMLQTQYPEIQRTNISAVVLLLKSLGIDVLRFPLLDPPEAGAVRASLAALWALGALDDEGNLTDIGKTMTKFPLEPHLARVLVAAHSTGCFDVAATAVALLSVPPPFLRPAGREQEADAARQKLMVADSDHLTLVNVFRRWLAASHASSGSEAGAKWCRDHFIQLRALQKAREVLAQLKDCRRDISGFNDRSERKEGREWAASATGVVLEEEEEELFRRALCHGHVLTAATMKSVSTYANFITGTPASLHPSSALVGLSYVPDAVVYNEMLFTGSKEYMSVVTAVEAEWLVEANPRFFSIRGSHSSRQPSTLRSSAASTVILARNKHESTPLAVSRPQNMSLSATRATPLSTAGGDSSMPPPAAPLSKPLSLAERLAKSKEEAKKKAQDRGWAK